MGWSGEPYETFQRLSARPSQLESRMVNILTGRLKSTELALAISNGVSAAMGKVTVVAPALHLTSTSPTSPESSRNGSLKAALKVSFPGHIINAAVKASKHMIPAAGLPSYPTSGDRKQAHIAAWAQGAQSRLMKPTDPVEHIGRDPP